MKKTPKIAIILISILAVVSSLVSGCRTPSGANPPTIQSSTDDQRSDKNIMGAENFKKQDALLEKATKQKNLTDEEVDWLIDFSRRGTVIANNEFASSRVRVRSLLILRSAELTPAQKEKVYQLCIPILANSVSDFSNADKASAINTLGKINDKRAIPYILPFADDKNKYTRRLANETLSKLK